jgi:hypothetical protein
MTQCHETSVRSATTPVLMTQGHTRRPRRSAYTPRMEREDLEALIREAFAGVRLGGGLSILQLEQVDEAIHSPINGHAFAEAWRNSVTDDWTQIPEDDLHTEYVAHMDAESLRYHLPALMLWLLDHYERGDMTTIGVLMALEADKGWRTYRRTMYDTFTPAQRAAVAAFVETFPMLVALDPMDEWKLELAFASYWQGQRSPST